MLVLCCGYVAQICGCFNLIQRDLHAPALSCSPGPESAGFRELGEMWLMCVSETMMSSGLCLMCQVSGHNNRVWWWWDHSVINSWFLLSPSKFFSLIIFIINISHDHHIESCSLLLLLSVVGMSRQCWSDPDQTPESGCSWWWYYVKTGGNCEITLCHSD